MLIHACPTLLLDFFGKNMILRAYVLLCDLMSFTLIAYLSIRKNWSDCLIPGYLFTYLRIAYISLYRTRHIKTKDSFVNQQDANK